MNDADPCERTRRRLGQWLSLGQGRSTSTSSTVVPVTGSTVDRRVAV